MIFDVIILVVAHARQCHKHSLVMLMVLILFQQNSPIQLWSGQVWQIIWNTVQRVLWHDSRKPPVPHALQHGPGLCHQPLGDGGGANRVENGGTWTVDIRLGGIFLC